MAAESFTSHQRHDDHGGVAVGLGHGGRSWITTAIGTSAARSLDHFTYTEGATPAPAVTGLSPTSGPTSGGTTVTISGANFTGATSVKFGTATATFTVNSATSITATSPSGSSGAVDVTVASSTGTSTTSSADRFTYEGPPTDSLGLNPSSGTANGGTSVTVTGTNFIGASQVLFNTSAATSFIVNSATSITAVSPAGLVGTIGVSVATPAGTSAPTDADLFTYTQPAPVITAISPTSGPSSGNTQVVITGSHFTGAGQVNFGNGQATSFFINSDTQITADSPAGSGTVDISVFSSAGGRSAATPADQFTFVTPPPPTPIVTSISPNSGSAAGGNTVTINGGNFTNVTSVKFGTVAATFTVVDTVVITVTSPAGAAGSIVDVTVTTNGGTSATSTADQFTYTAASAAPTVTGVSPNNGYDAGETTVTITGSNFNNVQQVFFGTGQATGIAVNSPTSLTVVSPQGGGTVDVTVETLSGTSATSAADKFTYTSTPPVPTITSVTPNQGTSDGAAQVTVMGTGFSTDSTILIGGVRPIGFNVLSVNEIFMVTAVQSAGVYDITVTNSSGTSPITAADKFTIAQGPPAVSSMAPTTGPGGGGTTVTFTGSGFLGATSVKFGATPATSFTVVSDTQLTAISPAGSGAVSVSLTTPNGVTPAGTFTYQATPVITQVSPNTGPTTGSPQVFITGVGFTGTTSVTFGGVAASFQTSGDTELIVNAPAQAAIGTVDIVVTTPQGVSPIVAADKYTYVVLPTITAVSPGQGDPGGGTTVVITGTGFTGASTVTFEAPELSFTVNSDTQITAVTPSGNGTSGVSVTTPQGTSKSNVFFVYTNAPAVPTVSSISSSSGSANGGATITVTGTNFVGASGVGFIPTTPNGIFGLSALSYTVNSDTSITVATPFAEPGRLQSRCRQRHRPERQHVGGRLHLQCAVVAADGDRGEPEQRCGERKHLRHHHGHELRAWADVRPLWQRPERSTGEGGQLQHHHHPQPWRAIGNRRRHRGNAGRHQCDLLGGQIHLDRQIDPEHRLD